MNTALLYGTDVLDIEIPERATVYVSAYPAPAASAADLVVAALHQPLGIPPLREALARRRSGDVVIVVSDITRPIPYDRFLGAMIREVTAAGVAPEEILLLIATGLHRPSSPEERRRMFGEEVCARCRILDHKAGEESDLLELAGRSQAGHRVRLNRHFVAAGFRIVTGLVEPHFMAGFSGGRKAVCPGLASIETLRSFHGYEFLANPSARPAQMAGNPCHLEALSVARLAGVDFALNVVLNHEREVVQAVAGELDASHRAACEFVRSRACPRVAAEHDIVLTSCGGSPLDTTFYQCVKGMVSCLPAVKRGGTVIAAGSCSEGVGSAEYAAMMFEYTGRWREFLEHIRSGSDFRKDQWQFQMHGRALAKLGPDNLCFATDGLSPEQLHGLSLRPVDTRESSPRRAIQTLLDRLLRQSRSLAVIPEGPYCAPVAAEPAVTGPGQ